jgi:hypothetical protein
MRDAERVGNFLHRITSDLKLGTSHVSVCAALCVIWVTNRLENPVIISRQQIMLAAKIRSRATYHKVIYDLVSLGYCKYAASYHPYGRSRMFIIN